MSLTRLVSANNTNSGEKTRWHLIADLKNGTNSAPKVDDSPESAAKRPKNCYLRLGCEKLCESLARYQEKAHGISPNQSISLNCVVSILLLTVYSIVLKLICVCMELRSVFNCFLLVVRFALERFLDIFKESDLRRKLAKLSSLTLAGSLVFVTTYACYRAACSPLLCILADFVDCTWFGQKKPPDRWFVAIGRPNLDRLALRKRFSKGVYRKGADFLYISGFE